MTSTYTPFGFRGARKRGGVPNSLGINKYRINPAGYNTNIANGDPVMLNSGYVTRASTSTDYLRGVFVGCRYDDPNTKVPQYPQMYAANTSVGSDPKGIIALVCDDPDQTYIIQADASVSVGDVGLNFDCTIGTSDSTFKKSRFGLAAGSRKTASGPLRIVGLWEQPDNAWSDAFPIVEVEIVQAAAHRVSAA